MSLNTILATTPLVSTNYILKATGTTIGNSLIYDNGSNAIGLGVTPSAWISTSKAFQIGNTASLIAPSSEAILGNNIFVDSTDNNKYITTNFASQYRQVNGQHLFYNAASGTAGNTITFTNVFSIANSGAATFTSGVTDAFKVINTSSTAYNSVMVQNDASKQVILGMGGSTLGNIYANTGYAGTVTATDFFLMTGTTERMRITSAGQVYVANTGGLNGMLNSTTTDGNFALTLFDGFGNNALAGFRNSSAAQIGSITIVSGGSTTSYNTTSDYRLKEDLKDFNGLEKVSAIKVYDFKWKSGDYRMDGVIAHELAEVIPYAVVGEKDAEEMQSVDYSKLTPILVKAIQEMNTKLDEQNQTIQNLQEQINILAK